MYPRGRIFMLKKFTKRQEKGLKHQDAIRRALKALAKKGVDIELLSKIEKLSDLYIRINYMSPKEVAAYLRVITTPFSYNKPSSLSKKNR